MKQSSSFYYSMLRSGLVVGVLDAIAASVYSFVLSGVSPDRVFLFVASAAFGQAAYEGGLAMAAIGLLFHFIVATGWTALYYFAYAKLKFLSANILLSGIAYGLFIWLIMNYLVIPLSQVPPRTIQFTIPTFVMIGIHFFVIGVPIAYLANQYVRSEA